MANYSLKQATVAALRCEFIHTGQGHDMYKTYACVYCSGTYIHAQSYALSKPCVVKRLSVADGVWSRWKVFWRRSSLHSKAGAEGPGQMVLDVPVWDDSSHSWLNTRLIWAGAPACVGRGNTQAGRCSRPGQSRRGLTSDSAMQWTHGWIPSLPFSLLLHEFSLPTCYRGTIHCVSSRSKPFVSACVIYTRYDGPFITSCFHH